jgi:hypothetical protein
LPVTTPGIFFLIATLLVLLSYTGYFQALAQQIKQIGTS